MMRGSHLKLLLASISLLASIAQAQNPTEPPPGQHLLLTVLGKGVQIYTCQQSSGVPQWVFQSPEATLFDTLGAKVGTHGAGPIWKYQDGSTIKGEVVARSASPDPTAIPWLLLKAISPSGLGILTQVDFIRRSDTHGGVALSTGCDAQHLAAVSRVPYAATYTFYSAKPDHPPTDHPPAGKS
jgi:hypothetical protein